MILPAVAWSQTPAPLQEWQYSRGIDLYKMFLPDIPDWQIETGIGVESRPLYEGASNYRVLMGPVIDVRYRDVAFASIGEGLGYNLLRHERYRVGIAVVYDLGRQAGSDLKNLKGLGDISPAPAVKLFGSYVISRDFPLVIRIDMRQFVGGASGLVGDIGAYIPLPGCTPKFAMFAGPSITLADRQHLQTEFGVTPAQARSSGQTQYLAHGGVNSGGFGVSTTKFVGMRWSVNADFSANRLLGSTQASPVTKTHTQVIGVLSFGYRW